MNQVFLGCGVGWGGVEGIGGVLKQNTKAHQPALFTFPCFILRLSSILGTSDDSVLATFPFFHCRKVIHNPPNNSTLFVQCDKAKGAFAI